VQAEPGIPREVRELGGVRHAGHPQLVLEEPGLHRADPRRAVNAHGGEHAEVPGPGVPADERLGDPRRLLGEFLPIRLSRTYTYIR